MRLTSARALRKEMDRARRGVRRRTERHRDVLAVMVASGIPVLVGGGHALRFYTGGVRGTRDLDVFVRPADAQRLLETLARSGFQTELAFPHWLGKVRVEGEYIDVIYSSGNGVARVDDEWFAHGVPASVLGIEVVLSPPEEMIWSKAFVMERERFDGADIAHLIRACHTRLDWARLLARFGAYWRVLLAHLVLFGFVYPSERARVPAELMRELGRRLDREVREDAEPGRLCRGTLLSREQYLVDIERWGYADARLAPLGSMSREDVAHWTAAIGESR